LSATWYEELAGFAEKSPRQVRATLILKGSTITSRVTGRKMEAGRLQTPTLAEIRERVSAMPAPPGSIMVEELDGDAIKPHAVSFEGASNPPECFD
jgi:hypothetical protein